jgi:hypothetical protein
MSRVSASSTFRTEDYPAEYRKELLPRLFQSLNLLVTQVVSAINGSIEFGINIPSLDNTIEFNFDGTLPSYKWTLNRTPKFVILGQAFEDGEPVAIAFTWGYSSSTGLVSITSAIRITSGGVSPLQNGSSYRISFRTLA